MPDIVLATLNAKYGHSSLGLRYLMANLGELAQRAVLREFTVFQRTSDIAEVILAQEPRIVGLGVYIWNAQLSLELVKVLKELRPELTVVLGGPEVSHECELQEIVRVADYTVCGEADTAFFELCSALLRDGKGPRAPIIRPPPPELAELQSPYALYSDEDIAHRSIYVEASRGCPFSCEFCLSSLDKQVRAFPLDAFLAEIERLIERGARSFKFIDRTFNLNMRISRSILEFFLERIGHGLFLHFEMIPDRLPVELRSVIEKFPPGSLQFEVGIQTFDVETSQRISRRQDYGKLADNLRFLRGHTHVHVHADLIIGLPGETLDSFARGFDQLVELDPQEIQVGVLKRLRGTPIVRHTESHGIVYSPTPPYEILESGVLAFAELQRLKRFARAWDLIANSGNFLESKALIWRGQSPFWAFLGFSDWLSAEVGAFHGVALLRLTRLLGRYLTQQVGIPLAEAKQVLTADYVRGGRRTMEIFDQAATPSEPAPVEAGRATPSRQARHLG